ncbi:multidrug effflux MFS transporter [Siminovitchia sediminis]|uniref:Bcr/CflA family efflux transporter n=1 Tax=Siminovitchia sediminis TaxID=1274353 RepID=A0ABW4KD22_9BACI
MKNVAYPQHSMDPAPKIHRMRAAVLLGSLTAFGPLSIDMYLPALPELASGYGASASLSQLSITSFLIGMAAGQIIMGPMSDTLGRKKPLLAGLIVFSVSSILCAAIPSIWGLIFMRLIQGASAATGIVIARAAARDLYSGTELTKFFALLMLVNGAAPIASPVAGGLLLSVMPWKGVFMILAFIGAAMLVAVLWGLPETLPSAKRSAGGISNMVQIFIQLIQDKVFMGYCLTQGFVMAAMFSYIAGSPFLLQEHFHLSPQVFGLIFSLNGAGIIIAAQITGRLAGKISEKILLILGLMKGLAGSGTLCLMLWLKADLIFVILPLFLAVSSVGIVGTSSFSLAMNDKERTAGSAAALHGLMPYIFGAAAAPVAGLGGGIMPMGITMAACHGLALSVYWFFSWKN